MCKHKIYISDQRPIKAEGLLPLYTGFIEGLEKWWTLTAVFKVGVMPEFKYTPCKMIDLDTKQYILATL